MDLGLSGKVAVVTGGSRGLGFAAAQAIVAEGAHVVICARGAEQLQRAVEQLRSASAAAQGRRRSSPTSPREDGVRKVIDAAVPAFGRLDVLVNNVGSAKGADIEATTDAEWQEAIDQTLFPAIRATRAGRCRTCASSGGAIVIVSSIFGREAGGRMTYNAVKAAEISLTKSLAQQLAKDGSASSRSRQARSCSRAGRGGSAQQADPERDRRVRRPRAAVRPVRPARRSRRRDRVSRLAQASWISGTTVVVDGCQSRMF